jgi:hypothetical protein
MSYVLLVVSFLLAFPPKSYMHFSSPHSCYMPRPSYPPWLDNSNYTWRTIQVMKLLIMHYVSTTKPNRLMLFGETVAVYCENHTEHTDTLCGQNVEFLPHRKHITSPLQSPTG